MKYFEVLHEVIDPLGRPTVIIVFAHVIQSHFSKSSKTKQGEYNVRNWRDCGPGRVDH